MKEKIAKTNAARLLDKAKVSYELIPYEGHSCSCQFGRKYRAGI